MINFVTISVAVIPVTWDDPTLSNVLTPIADLDMWLQYLADDATIPFYHTPAEIAAIEATVTAMRQTDFTTCAYFRFEKVV